MRKKTDKAEGFLGSLAEAAGALLTPGKKSHDQKLTEAKDHLKTAISHLDIDPHLEKAESFLRDLRTPESDENTEKKPSKKPKRPKKAS